MKRKSNADTTQKQVLPSLFLAALKVGGYKVDQLSLGERPGGAKAGRYPVAMKGSEKVAITLRTQEGAGSAE